MASKYAGKFPKIDPLTIDGDFGGWKSAQQRFCADGGVFDRINAANPRR